MIKRWVEVGILLGLIVFSFVLLQNSTYRFSELFYICLISALGIALLVIIILEMWD